MVRAQNFIKNPDFVNPSEQGGGGKKVVYAPSDIALPSEGLHVPVSVGTLDSRMKMSENIYITVAHDFIEPGSFDRQETGVLFVLFSSGQIDIRMGGIYIPAEYDFQAFLLQPIYIRQKLIIKP